LDFDLRLLNDARMGDEVPMLPTWKAFVVQFTRETTALARPVVVAIVCGLCAAFSGCGSNSSTTAATVVMANDIPVAHTPPGGFGDTFPEPVLATCTEPLVEGAPDLRGLWKTLRAEQTGKPVPADDRFYLYVERIEQCGNRIVDMGGGTIADARADGSEENGVHDVSARDFKTPINVVATYENGVFVLRPVGIFGIEVTRRLDADGHMVWTRPDLGHLTVTLDRIGDGGGTPHNTFPSTVETGGLP
jgi:hypothetical protein